MRRVSAIDGNVCNLSAMNNRIMSQLFEMEGQFDEAAGIIQGVQQINEAPQQPRERRNVGYNAFAGQGHRIRSPTPTPGEGNGRDTGLPVRPGGGVGLADHVLPNVPDRVDPSRADRHPINPDRERADSRSRRARGLPDRSHSPPGRARDGPRACARGDISVSPNRDVGRNRSPDRGSEVRSRQSRGERPIRDSGSISPSLERPIRDSGNVSPNTGRNPGGGRGNRAHADIQSPGRAVQTSRVPETGGGLLELRLIMDRPRCRPQEELPALVAQARQRFVPSMIPTTVGARTLNSRVLRVIVSFAGHVARMLRRSPCISARIVELTSVRITVTLEMTALSDVRAAIFGMNALKLDRPLLLLPGEVVGKADHLVKVGAEAVVMDMLHFHRQVLDILAEAKVLLNLLEGRVEGLLPGYPGGAPGFSGSAADAHGTGNNQCGSSFYGPAYGGGVSHQGVGAGINQSSDAAGYPSSIASGALRRVLASAIV